MIAWTLRSTIAFWPGFRRAWHKSDAQSLLLAIGFAWTVCFLAVANFYWTQWYPAWLVRLATFSVAGFSLLVGLRYLLFGDKNLEHRETPTSILDRERDFRFAQESYLQGAYFEAEQYLLKNLKANERDVESSLLLATILRRTDRFDEATELLSQLLLRENAAKWAAEIIKEKEKCLRTKRQSREVPPPKD